MKRKLGLLAIFATEISFIVLYFIDSVWGKLRASGFFNFFYNIFNAILSWIISWFNGFDYFFTLPHKAQYIIALIIFSIIFVIIYLIIFGILDLIIDYSKKRKIQKHTNKVFSLSEEEKARFEWQLYKSNFPLRRIVSLIVPIFFVLICFVIRFDQKLCLEVDKFNQGYFNIYENVAPYLGNVDDFLTFIFSEYIRMVDKIYNSIGYLPALEFIAIALIAVVIMLVWYGFFSLFAKPFSKHVAKRRARKARKNYIQKMELLEYKAWKKNQKDQKISEKNRELNPLTELFVETEEAEILAIGNYVTKDNTDVIKDETVNKEYIDDISTGVTDLGLIEEDNEELLDPLTQREISFVGDEEIDIILEEEPVVETIEEQEEYFDTYEEMEETYTPYSNNFSASLEIEDKIKKYEIEVIEENNVVKVEEEIEPFIQEYEDSLIVKEINEETFDRDDLAEEVVPVTEEVPQEETIEETPTEEESLAIEETPTEEATEILDVAPSEEIPEVVEEVAETSEEIVTPSEENNTGVINFVKKKRERKSVKLVEIREDNTLINDLILSQEVPLLHQKRGRITVEPVEVEIK